MRLEPPECPALGDAPAPGRLEGWQGHEGRNCDQARAVAARRDRGGPRAADRRVRFERHHGIGWRAFLFPALPVRARCDGLVLDSGAV